MRRPVYPDGRAWRRYASSLVVFRRLEIAMRNEAIRTTGEKTFRPWEFDPGCVLDFWPRPCRS